MRSDQIKFKETEIGTIPEEWDIVALGDILSLEYGKALKEEDRVLGDIPVYGSNGAVGFHDKKLVNGPGVVVGRKGSAGEVIFSEKAFFPIDTTYFVKTGLDIKYVYYLLKVSDIKNLVSSSAVPGLNRNDLYAQKVAIPKDNNEQTQIAEILSSLDDKIELNRKMNENLEKIASALFKNWFVDFEFPDKNGKPYKSSGGKMAESELGEIPEVWSVKKIGEVAIIKGGSTPDTNHSEYWQDGSIAWVTPRDLSNLKSLTLLETEKKITAAGLNTISSGLLPVNTILLSSRAPIGYVAINNIPVAINQGFIAINSDESVWYYLFIWVKNNIDLIKSYANGSTFLEINKSNFRGINLIVPASDLLVNFNDIIEPIINSIVENEKEIKNLSTIRDFLLPRLIGGVLRAKYE